jgi:hypothetical protein
LYFSVLERTEFDLSKINWFRGIILLHSNSVGSLGQDFIVSHSYQTYFGFLGANLNLDCGLCDHVITRFTSDGMRARLRNEVISLYYLCFVSVPLSFSMFVSFIFLFFMFVASKKSYISSSLCL